MNKVNIHVSSLLMSSLHAIVICKNTCNQNYCYNDSNPPFCTFTCNDALYTMILMYLTFWYVVRSSPTVDMYLSMHKTPFILSHGMNYLPIKPKPPFCRQTLLSLCNFCQINLPSESAFITLLFSFVTISFRGYIFSTLLQ